jgi:hypothetical protein
MPEPGNYLVTSQDAPTSIAGMNSGSAGRLLDTVLLEERGGRENRYSSNGLRYGGTAVSFYTNNQNRGSW